MKLLVSVKNKAEALEAIRGGADILDVKNPFEGSLGANFPRIIREVKQIAPAHIPVSATIGDLPDLPGTASLAALGAAASGAQYIKAGLFGVRTFDNGLNLMKEVCIAVKDYDNSVKVIAAGYADFRTVGSLDPRNLPEVAHRSGASGVMIDVKMKEQGGLFHYLTSNELSKLAQKAREKNLIVAVAGSLTKNDIPRVYKLGADIMGVRKAVCSFQDRVKGTVSCKAVSELVQATHQQNSTPKLPVINEMTK